MRRLLSLIKELIRSPEDPESVARRMAIEYLREFSSHSGEQKPIKSFQNKLNIIDVTLFPPGTILRFSGQVGPGHRFYSFYVIGGEQDGQPIIFEAQRRIFADCTIGFFDQLDFQSLVRSEMDPVLSHSRHLVRARIKDNVVSLDNPLDAFSPVPEVFAQRRFWVFDQYQLDVMVVGTPTSVSKEHKSYVPSRTQKYPSPTTV